MEDKQIIALLWRRSEDAIAALTQQFGHRLQRLAKNILPTESDAQECVNDTYLAVWNSIPPQCPEPLAPYVLRLCKNISVSRLRQLTAQKRGGYALSLAELEEAIGTESLDQFLAARELGQAIDRFLDTLNKLNRVIFLRRYWYGDSIEEIAKMVSLTQSSVSVRLHRARAALKTYLIKEGLYER